MNDEYFMQLALEQAKQAANLGEIPVGAVIVIDGKVIASTHNQSIKNNDPSAHAEILALRLAGQNIKNYRLIGATLYVTLEPCIMCFGALLHARIKRVVFGAYDYKTGALGSLTNLNLLTHNHIIEVTSGVLNTDCSKILSDFFAQRRIEIKQKKLINNS